MTPFVNIESAVVVPATIALVVEPKEHFSTVLAKGWAVVGVLLKNMWDARVKLGALWLSNCSSCLFWQPVSVDHKFIIYLCWLVLMLSDSHALWAAIDDLVVAPLVEGHLAALTGETLDKALEWTKD